MAKNKPLPSVAEQLKVQEQINQRIVQQAEDKKLNALVDALQSKMEKPKAP